MRGAIVIRYGDPEIAEAIASGMEAAHRLSVKEMNAVSEEMKRLRKCEARLKMRSARDDDAFRKAIEMADYYYTTPKGNVVTDFLWGIYGLLVETIGGWLDYFYSEMSKG